jgi:hypothetical protein
MYAMFAMLGAGVILRPSPTLDFATSAGVQYLLAAGVCGAGLIASMSAIRESWETIEAWAAAAIIVSMSGYVASAALFAVDGGSILGLLLLIMVTILVVARWWQIASRMGIRDRNGDL